MLVFTQTLKQILKYNLEFVEQWQNILDDFIVTYLTRQFLIILINVIVCCEYCARESTLRHKKRQYIRAFGHCNYIETARTLLYISPIKGTRISIILLCI